MSWFKWYLLHFIIISRILRAIKSYEDSNEVKIIDIKEVENDEGLGFMSTLVKIKIEALVDGKNEKYSWIVKALPRDIHK